MSVGMEGLTRVSALGLPYLESRAVEAILEAHGFEGSDEYERRLLDAEECLRAAREQHRGQAGPLRLTGPVETRAAEVMPGALAEPAAKRRSRMSSAPVISRATLFRNFGDAVEAAAAQGPRWRACEKCWTVRGVVAFRTGSKVCRSCRGESQPGGRTKSGTGSAGIGKPRGRSYDLAPASIEVKRKYCPGCDKTLAVQLFPRDGRLCENCLEEAGDARLVKGKRAKSLIA